MPRSRTSPIQSTASLAGNLLGATYGVGALPSRWVDEVEMRDVVERIADDLHACTVSKTELGAEAYPGG